MTQRRPHPRARRPRGRSDGARGRNADIKVGNSLTFRQHPARPRSTTWELKKGKGAARALRRRVRAAHGQGRGLGADLRLPSGEIRKVHLDCRATIGQVSNPEHANISLGKAGRMRWPGFRPHNRGASR
ncbi:MAG: hypothetical protein U0414_04975 [Polyangiaceae bacterium]